MGQISISGYEDEFTVTGEVDDVLLALRQLAGDRPTAPLAWVPMRTVDGYKV
jgi:hypothetical protein